LTSRKVGGKIIHLN